MAVLRQVVLQQQAERLAGQGLPEEARPAVEDVTAVKDVTAVERVQPIEKVQLDPSPGDRLI